MGGLERNSEERSGLPSPPAHLPLTRGSHPNSPRVTHSPTSRSPVDSPRFSSHLSELPEPVGHIPFLDRGKHFRPLPWHPAVWGFPLLVSPPRRETPQPQAMSSTLTTSVLHESESESHSIGFDSLGPHGLYSPWNSPGQNTGVGSLSLLQRIFLTQDQMQVSRILHQLSYQASPRILEWVA